jgi:hypothetical protein
MDVRKDELRALEKQLASAQEQVCAPFVLPVQLCTRVGQHEQIERLSYHLNRNHVECEETIDLIASYHEQVCVVCGVLGVRVIF